MPDETQPDATFTPESYRGVVTMSGADKLADSQVAPLVAQARGYSTAVTAADAKKVAADAYTTQDRKAASTLKSLVKGGHDILVIPWYRCGDVARKGPQTLAASTQVRPSQPMALTPGGKPAKYLLVPGCDSVIDANPGVPAGWAARPVRVLVTEGVLKADAALTGMLLGAGVTGGELGATTDTDTARARLAELLERVPAPDRYVILALVGVGNWHQNPEWASLDLRDRDVLVAFDGDMHQNHQVWAQASHIWRFLENSKHATPRLLDLGGPDAEAQQLAVGWDVGHRLGVDDYLAHVGTWADLMQLAETALPPEPDNIPDPAHGLRYQMAPDGCAVMERVDVKTDNPFGGPATGHTWQELIGMGGRVVRVESRRVLVDTSVRDGRIRPGAVIESASGECVIELSWHDPDTDKVVTRPVTGPMGILGAAPIEWARMGAVIHTDILRHPEWPPRNKAGDGFLIAVKAHRFEEQQVFDGWDTMGWVPSRSGTPVFIVGTQTLGATRDDEDDNHPGVTEEIMPGATSFGVTDTYWRAYDRGDGDGWKAQVLSDVRAVIDAFLLRPGWKDPAIGAVVMACALRPTVPGATTINLWLSGAPGMGKSYLASFIMSFWAARPGVWTEFSLPGSANDTMAAREHSTARTPIWVVDDLAPNVSRVKAEQQESAIEEAVRAQFNGQGKRRGNADGTQRAVARPRALIVYTAENRRDNVSIRQRMISLHLAAGSKVTEGDRPAQIAQLARGADNPFARLTAAMIRFWVNLPVQDTVLPLLRADVDAAAADADLAVWSGRAAFAAAGMQAAKQEVQEALEALHGVPYGKSARRAGMFGELFFTLDVLQALAVWAGMPEDDPAMRAMSAAVDDTGSLRGAMVALAAQDLDEQRAHSNSRSLLEAVRLLLESGKAHLEHPTLSGVRPVPGGTGTDPVNRAAGWRKDPKQDTWVPSGEPVGWLGCLPRGDGQPVALLSGQTVFNLAQRHYPTLVPAGQKAADSWSQVWEDEDGAQIPEDYRHYAASGRAKSTVAVRLAPLDAEDGADGFVPSGEPAAGTLRARGVPVLWNEIVAGVR